MDANQQQQTPGTGANASQAEASGSRLGQMFGTLGERIRSGELKARLHYFLFRQTQQAKASDSLFSKYKHRLKEDWHLWVGIGTGLMGLAMLLSPEGFWRWQLPLIILAILLAPAFFEIPAALNSLFGHTEQQHLVGKVITLTRPIVDGRGQTTLDEREWLVSGPDCQAGKEVRVVTLDSKMLYVMPVSQIKRISRT